jgi:quinone-modifying oxidoreductase subunit QmoA
VSADLRSGDQFPPHQGQSPRQGFTLAEVQKVDGGPAITRSAVKINPRYVNENCTCCGECAEACQTPKSSECLQFRMKKAKGAYLPFEMAFPARYVIA